MNRLSLFLTGIICLVFISSYAQPVVGSGCKIGTRRYQVSISPEAGYSPLFRDYPGDANSEWENFDSKNALYSCYSWVPDVGVCYVKTPTGCGLFGFSACYNSGTKGHFTGIVGCPLDDYTPFLLIVAGGIGVFTLRKGFS